jgi:hypothetical protein
MGQYALLNISIRVSKENEDCSGRIIACNGIPNASVNAKIITKKYFKS